MLASPQLQIPPKKSNTTIKLPQGSFDDIDIQPQFNVQNLHHDFDFSVRMLQTIILHNYNQDITIGSNKYIYILEAPPIK